MKKLWLVVLAVLFLAGNVWALGGEVGTSTITDDRISINQTTQRCIITVTATAAIDGASPAAISINPVSYCGGITGWYLYTVETDPGSTAPAVDWDIALQDANGLDVTGSQLLNRHTSTTQLIMPKQDGTNFGFPVIRGAWTMTITNMTNANSTASIIMIFTAN